MTRWTRSSSGRVQAGRFGGSAIRAGTSGKLRSQAVPTPAPVAPFADLASAPGHRARCPSSGLSSPSIPTSRRSFIPLGTLGSIPHNSVRAPASGSGGGAATADTSGELQSRPGPMDPAAQPAIERSTAAARTPRLTMSRLGPYNALGAGRPTRVRRRGTCMSAARPAISDGLIPALVSAMEADLYASGDSLQLGGSE